MHTLVLRETENGNWHVTVASSHLDGLGWGDHPNALVALADALHMHGLKLPRLNTLESALDAALEARR